MRSRSCLLSRTSSPSCNITSSCPKASTNGWRDTRPQLFKQRPCNQVAGSLIPAATCRA